MFYETKTKRPNGPEGKPETVALIIDALTFTEAEAKTSAYLGPYGEHDIVAIKRSAVKEFVNAQQAPDDKIYFVKLTTTTIGDNGKEKKIHYTVALFAPDIKAANTAAEKYVMQGLEDMQITALRETPLEIIEETNTHADKAIITGIEVTTKTNNPKQ